jgi:hypothetical protein
MTVERAGLSASLRLEPLAPARSASTVQGQSLPEHRPEYREGKPRRRPAPDESSDESQAEASAEESDLPLHRIDSVA